jgi:hypothetical protein
MSHRIQIYFTLLTVPALLLVAAPASAAPPKHTGTKASRAIARQIASLERLTDTLSGEVAALKTRTVTTAPAPPPAPAPPAPVVVGPPIPAPPSPAGGDLTGSFPDPGLRPGSVGNRQLGEGVVGSATIADGSVGGAQVTAGSITEEKIGSIEEADLGLGLSSSTLGEREFQKGPEVNFHVPPTDLLTLHTACEGRLLAGGWRVTNPSFRPGDSIMASFPAFNGGGESPERDWDVVVFDENQLMDDSTSPIWASELCLSK